MGPVLRAIFWKCGTDKLQKQQQEVSSFFEFKVKSLQGQEIGFDSYANKKAILVVNVASKCKLTFQNYKGLTKMHNQLSNQGLEVLAFPCNQFLNQENQTHQHIVKFVRHKFGTKFTLFEKVDVNGPNTHPVFRYLRNNSSLYDKASQTAKLVPWNFSKFLLNEKGQVVRFFEPQEELDQIRRQVEKLLQ